MTTLHKAAQMALDALDAITDDVDGTGLNTMPSFDKALDAIATLREALNAPEPEPVARCILDNGDEMGSVEWLVRPRSIRLDHGSLLYAAPPAAPAPDGWVTVPNYRGYAALGTGRYILDISADANPAELIIHVATEAEKEGRTVGDLRDRGGPGESIAPEKMAVRLAFFTVAGLDALEQQLRILRKTHFPAAPVPDALAEAVAKAIYWEWRRDAGYVPWVDGGNSLKQDDARKIARAVVSSAAPVVREPQPEPVQRLMRFAGKKRSEVSNPCLTAREAIVIADWMQAHGIGTTGGAHV